MGDKKWILYNNVERKRLWGKWNEPSPTVYQRPVFIQRRWCCMVGLEGSPLLWTPFRKPNNSDTYCSQLDQLKAALDKVSRTRQQKMHDLPSGQCKSTHFSDDQIKIVTAWLGTADTSTRFTRHYAFGFPFILVFTKILLLEKISIPWKTVKGTLTVLCWKR